MPSLRFSSNEPLSLRLLPLAALLRREVLSSLRRARTLFLIGGATGATLILFVYSLMKANPNNLFVEEQVVSLVQAIILALTLLLIPPMTIFSLREEQVRGTLDMLAMTHARAFTIVGVKMLNAGMVFVLILVALLPIFGVCFFFTGLSTAEFIETIAVMLMTCTLASAVSATFAVSVRSRAGAMMLIYPILIFILIPLQGFGLSTPAGDFRELATKIFYATLVVLLLAAPFVAVAASNFLLMTQVPAAGETALKAAPPFRRMWPANSIVDNWNPIFRRELCAGSFNGKLFIYAAVAYALLCLGASTMTSRSLQSFDIPSLFLFHSYCFTLLCPVLVAALMADEHEQEHMDMLRMTLLSAKTVVYGKFWAGVIFLLPLLLVPALSVLLGLLFVHDPTPWLREAPIQLAGLFNLTCFLVALSLAAALPCRRASVAYFAAAGISILFVFALPYVALELYFSTATRAYKPWEMFIVAAWPSPYFAETLGKLLQQKLPSFTHGTAGGGNRNLQDWKGGLAAIWYIHQFALPFWTVLLLSACKGHYEKKLLRDV